MKKSMDDGKRHSVGWGLVVLSELPPQSHSVFETMVVASRDLVNLLVPAAMVMRVAGRQLAFGLVILSMEVLSTVLDSAKLPKSLLCRCHLRLVWAPERVT